MARRRRGGLAAWLSDAATPVFVLNERRIVLFFNRACEELTGWSAADVVGRTCDYASEPDPQQVECLTGAMSPPPDLAAGAAAVVAIPLRRRDGTTLQRAIHFLSLPPSAEDETHILGFILPPGGEDQAPPAVGPRRLHTELAALRASLRDRYRFDGLIARGPAMLRAAEQARVAAASDAALHLFGEEGSGREHLARLIHYNSSRRLEVFAPIDCAALSDFEIKRVLRRAVAAETPDEAPAPGETPGLLFLRNVERLPRELQQLLLDELLTPPSRGDAPSPPRVISCGFTPLSDAVADGRILPALAYRLTPLSIEIPPLRERSDELLLLAQFFLEQVNRNVDRQVGGFSQEVQDLFRRYRWPGNVRELRQVIESAHSAATGAIVVGSDLPFRFRTGADAQSVGPAPVARRLDLAEYLKSIERGEIERALADCRGNRTLAARVLGLTRPRLYRRMEQLGLNTGDEEPESTASPPAT